MSPLLLCLCAIILAFSVACRDNAEVVQSVSGETRSGPATEAPSVVTRPTPTEAAPQNVPASPVADTAHTLQPRRQDQHPTPTGQPTVQAADADSGAEPTRQGPSPTLASQPTVAPTPTAAPTPTVAVKPPGGDGAPTRAAEPTPSKAAVSGTTETVPVDIPRHHREPVINMGFDYLYGELFESDGCLRVPYLGPNVEDHIPGGVLIIWPPGFTARRVAGVIEVVSQDGLVMARVGDKVRLSGVGPGEIVGDSALWDWSEDAAGDCAGFHWLVGDEVSAVTDEPHTIISAAGIVVPRMQHQEGPKSSPAVLLNGRLVLQERCLRTESVRGGTGRMVVWPPGFRAEVRNNRVVVTNGGGSVIVRVGDKFKAGGGQAPVPDFPQAPDCSGMGFWAYEVLPLD